MLREIDMLRSYPQPEERVVGDRTIQHRILASYRGYDFFDGKREYGYGGMKDDNRWSAVAADMCKEYEVTKDSIILQINCEKGYLLRAFIDLLPGVKVVGVEPSSYARRHAPESVKKSILPSWKFDVEAFDLVIALGVVYTFNLPDAIACLRKIDRLGFRSFITLAAYETEEDLRLFKKWSLLGTTILKRDEWIEVMDHAGYVGDFSFVTAQSLRLRERWLPTAEEEIQARVLYESLKRA